MHNPGRPFRLVGQLSRNVYDYWKAASSTTRPFVRRVQSALYWLPTLIVFTQVGCTVRTVTGNSMQPTLNPDLSRPRDVAIFNRWSVVIERRYERGDIVAFRSPREHGKLLVKRLIALPGDKVKTLPPHPETEVTIPAGHGWLEGDAPFNSEDSNHFGPVPLALIDSKLTWVFWPVDRAGFRRFPFEWPPG
ncbi:peptidase S24/S26A/S26B/S26C [Russula earlei]|uniref:Peptidase S24/S26A/S26B/S26C n=1 Tax=Russula earlei TaxID=71964 RepID=A0ACC0UNB0_9AGAM|nr:peptidase S24/S26A/S26B/S26C [Russula earlei]